jgi:hypothetical protein
MPLQAPPINGPIFALQGGIHARLKHYWGSNEERQQAQTCMFSQSAALGQHPTFSLSLQIMQVAIPFLLNMIFTSQKL